MASLGSNRRLCDCGTRQKCPSEHCALIEGARECEMSPFGGATLNPGQTWMCAIVWFPRNSREEATTAVDSPLGHDHITATPTRASSGAQLPAGYFTGRRCSGPWESEPALLNRSCTWVNAR